jgi:hypothetical protein
MNRNLLAILVEAGSFDEIPATAIAALAGSLMFFFLGLLLLDMEQRAPARRLAKDVSGLMTTNQPAPLDVSKYGNHLRSLVSSINEFIESRKTFVATKRAKVDSGSQETVAAAAPATAAAPIAMVELEMEPIQDESEPEGVKPSSSPSLADSPFAPSAVTASDSRPSGSAAALPPPVDLEEFLPFAPVTSTAERPAVRLDKVPATEAAAPSSSPATVIEVSRAPSTVSQPLSEELLAALVGAADSSISYPQERASEKSGIPEAAAEVSREILADELTAAAEAALNPAPSPLSLEAKLQTMQGGGFMTGNFASASGTFPGVSGSYPSVMGSRASLDPEFRGLFDSYQAARKACGESTDKHTHAKFLERVLKNREEIIAKTGCKDVSFEAIIKEGKASLKATPIR